MKQKTIVELQERMRQQIQQITHSQGIRINHFEGTYQADKRIEGAFTEIAIPADAKLKRWQVKTIAAMVAANYDKVKSFSKQRGIMQFSGEKQRFQTIKCLHE